jgi:hypothetical protein
MPAHEQGAQTGDDTIFGSQVGRALSAAIQDAQLMFDEHRFGNDRPEATGRASRTRVTIK